jgi:hypothetical protein
MKDAIETEWYKMWKDGLETETRSPSIDIIRRIEDCR